MTDPLTAGLAEAREIIEGGGPWELEKLARRLCDGLEAVLVLSGQWRQKGLALGHQIAAEDIDGARAGFMMCTAQAHENCAQATRMALTAALTGEAADT